MANRITCPNPRCRYMGPSRVHRGTDYCPTCGAIPAKVGRKPIWLIVVLAIAVMGDVVYQLQQYQVAARHDAQEARWQYQRDTEVRAAGARFAALTPDQHLDAAQAAVSARDFAGAHRHLDAIPPGPNPDPRFLALRTVLGRAEAAEQPPPAVPASPFPVEPRVQVRGYYRRDGTYVRGYTRRR